LDVQRLEAAVMRPRLALEYQPELDLIGLAAYYWHAISASHGFVDANKRTAFLTAVAFLEANGVELVADPFEPGRMVLHWFETGTFSQGAIAAYLGSRCRWKT
jgi:death-on-curing protein